MDSALNNLQTNNQKERDLSFMLKNMNYVPDKLNLDFRYDQVRLIAPVPARSPKLSSDESVQYLNGWPV